jgi:hypothetical protein
MNRYEDFEDGRIKHLEMLQGVIARLGNDSFLIKGWAVTVFGVFLGFAVDTKQWELGVASAVPTLFFWALDTYFLRAERLFRVLYEAVREQSAGTEPFFMSATSPSFVARLTGPRADAASACKTFWRPTLSGFYGALVVCGLVLSLAICCG